MLKQYARARVLIEYNGKSDQVRREKGISLVYDNQKEKAVQIYEMFMSGVSLVTLVTSPQWGKTGVALELMKLMTTHPDDAIMTHPDNVFIITGMSDKDWRAQTKERVLPCFQNRVFHRNDMHKIIAELAHKRDVLIIIDECHFGSENTHTLHECLKVAGILDIEHMQQQNIKILCISATPGNVLLDAVRWGPQHHQKIVAQDNGTLYTSFKTLLEEDRVKPALDIKKESKVRFLLDIIESRWDTPRYHIIRASDKAFRASPLERIVAGRGYTVEQHNSNSRILDIEAKLGSQPSEHHFIIIKGYWRAAKTLEDTFLGVCLEATKDYSASAQGLGGRLLGYGRQRGSQAPLLFCDVPAVQGYVNFLDNEADYHKCKEYNSTTLKISKGHVKKAKTSTVHPSEIENLVAVELESPDVDGGNQPKRVGVVHTIPPDAVLATRLDIYTVPKFLAKFDLKEMPRQAIELSKAMKAKGLTVNTSFKVQPARSVANLVNFYTNPEWAACQYHIIKLEDEDEVMVITRDRNILDNVKSGDKIVAHNSVKKMVLYQF